MCPIAPPSLRFLLLVRPTIALRDNVTDLLDRARAVLAALEPEQAALRPAVERVVRICERKLQGSAR